MELINKDILVEEIKKRKDKNQKICTPEASGAYYENDFILDIINSLDTIEMKKVDLEKALDDYVYQEGLVNCYEIAPIAKHFFELGLKAQKDIYK